MKVDKLEGWKISINEVSNGVYQVTAIDRHGQRVETTGTNIDKLIADCKASIFKIDQKASLDLI